jgi:catechol 2,3-dioxygenase-like lactoylglutathione lyase family enzyme
LRINAVTLVVDDYDRAIAWFTGALGFGLVEDSDLGGGKRWVVVAPHGGGTQLVLAKAVDDSQRARVGDQTGGRVAFFLRTDDFARDFAAFTANGVTFVRPPKQEAYGKVAVFEDCCGNLWDLIEI